MSDQGNIKEIRDADIILEELLPLVDQAEHEFQSARGWGVVDILGGGLITNLIKHAKINSAKDTMFRINELLRDLQRELSDIRIPADYQMETGGFSTFADFVFDGVLADVYMQSKILSSLEQVRELRRRLEMLRTELRNLKGRDGSF
jgi:hypothetical protein